MVNSNRFVSHAPLKPHFHYGYSFLFVVLNSILTIVFLWQLPPQIPLFYSFPYGASQLADRIWFVLLPLLSLVTWLSYFSLSKVEYRSAIFIQILKWLHLTCLFLLSTAVIHILLVVL